MSTKGDNHLAKRNVAVLICAQAILGSQMPMIFTVGGLAGQSLASNACFATSYFNDCAGLHDYSFPSIKLNAKIWKKIWLFIGAIGGFTGGIIEPSVWRLALFIFFCLEAF